jgi:PAS domain S-box-containing protein
VWVERTARAIFDEGNNVIGEIGRITNITERRREDEARSRFASIVESSADAMIGMDLNGLITAWNSGAERMFGYTEEEAIGKHITVVVPTELRDEEEVTLRRLRQGKQQYLSTPTQNLRAQQGRSSGERLVVRPGYQRSCHACVLCARVKTRRYTLREKLSENSHPSAIHF